jgi:hypothetical protein
MEVEKKDHLHLLNRPLHLVGFSKGVVVLNQLITEMSTSETFGTARTVSCMNAKLSSFYNTIVSFQWLGGGNGSNRGAFPLYSIPNTGKRIQYGIHITPYQLYSNERPWIREEMQQFVSKLHSRHIPVSSCVYFEHEPPSLHQHFQLLQVWQLENCPNWYLDSKSNSNSNSNSSNDSSIDVRTGQNCGFNSVATSSSSSSTSDASMAQ